MQKKKGWHGIKVDQDRWSIYLDSLEDEPVSLSEKHACAVREVWGRITDEVDGLGDDNFRPLSLPIAGPGGEQGFQVAWNTKRFYLDIDIAEDGSFEWYCLDRETGVDCGSDYKPIKKPPKQLLELLKKFCCKED